MAITTLTRGAAAAGLAAMLSLTTATASFAESRRGEAAAPYSGYYNYAPGSYAGYYNTAPGTPYIVAPSSGSGWGWRDRPYPPGCPTSSPHC